jgi:hypothetical protein
MRKLALFVLPLFFVFAACQDGGVIPFKAAPPDKHPPARGANVNVVKVVLYIDTADGTAAAETALKEVGRYTIDPDTAEWKYNSNKYGTPYFDMVVLGGGQMKAGKVSPRLELTGELKSVLSRYDALIQPLQQKGIKVLLGVSGGNDGIALGCLPVSVDDEKLPNRVTPIQLNFARQVYDACRYNQLDGVEFWDKDGEGGGVNPYPKMGEKFFNGEQFLPEDGVINSEEQLAYYWKRGGGHMVDMLSHVVEEFGAVSSFQGDTSKTDNPVIIRETGYGRWLPTDVPRYAFSDTMQTLDYVVNSSTDNFGFYGDNLPDLNDDGLPDQDREGAANADMHFVRRRAYGPVMIDLAAVTPAKLTEYSQKLGNGEDVNKAPPDCYYAVPGSSEYGIVYYLNLGAHTAAQLGLLNETASKVYGSTVMYEGN